MIKQITSESIFSLRIGRNNSTNPKTRCNLGNVEVDKNKTTKPKTEAMPRNEDMVYYYDEEYYSTLDG